MEKGKSNYNFSIDTGFDLSKAIHFSFGADENRAGKRKNRGEIKMAIAVAIPPSLTPTAVCRDLGEFLV